MLRYRTSTLIANWGSQKMNRPCRQFAVEPILFGHFRCETTKLDMIPNLRFYTFRVSASQQQSIFLSEQSYLSRSLFRRSRNRQLQRHFSSLVPATVSPISNEDVSRLETKENSLARDEKSVLESYLDSKGIKSRPKDGGNWNVYDPLGWTRGFGQRSKDYNERLKKLACLQQGDEGYYNGDLKKDVEGVTIVRTKEEAKIVLEKLNAAPPNTFHAADTEVMDIDIKNVGPVGNGYVTCVSIFSGPDFDYGLGNGPGTTLWIDNLDDAYGLILEFKEWFENENHLKVWHHYGFDRHCMWNEGIDVKGFGGDTMHMARLLDTSRIGHGGYSLEALTTDMLGRGKVSMKKIFGVPRKRRDGTDSIVVDVPPVEVLQRNPEFREKFILYSCYDAHATWSLREKLEATLRETTWLGGKSLYDYYWMHMRQFGEVLTDMERRGVYVDARDYLAKVEIQARKDREEHAQIFTEWAAKQYPEEKRAHALAMNPASSAQLQTFLFGGSRNPKTNEVTPKVRAFQVPREELSDEAWKAYEEKDKREKEEERQAKTNSDESILTDEAIDELKATAAKQICKKLGLKQSGQKADVQQRLKDYFRDLPSRQRAAEIERDLESLSDQDLRDALASRGLRVRKNQKREKMIEELQRDIETAKILLDSPEADPSDGYSALMAVFDEAAKLDDGSPLSEYVKSKTTKKDPKYVQVEITSLDVGLEPSVYTAGGAPSVTAPVLKKLAGDPASGKYGDAFERLGEEGCRALSSLCAIGSIDTMIANFLTSLQKLADQDSRVHCSLNLNTETGRLSSRNPNLQNQPALEKDKYKIRQAFQASPGNNLIVADYGQLELRILASLTKCKSMISAFESGGDFHSRTAMDMFDYIKEKVEAEEVLLEWDYSEGDPPKPLVKDQFAAERRKAKTLNFSIAYGKTAHGLSKDWGVTQKEAEAMLEKWYNARPEVRDWQQTTKETARNHGITRTIMGRYRHLPEAMSGQLKLLGHAERASINTPIQGGAADIAMMAMNKINSSQKLKHLGWILLLQIHDEVVLEGPEETAEEAFGIVLECMQEPWVYGLNKTEVPLLVDGSFKYKTWYDAK